MYRQLYFYKQKVNNKPGVFRVCKCERYWHVGDFGKSHIPSTSGWLYMLLMADMVLQKWHFQQVHGSIVTVPWQCHPSPHVLRPIPKASVTLLHWIESDRGSPKWREVSFDDTTSVMANVPQIVTDTCRSIVLLRLTVKLMVLLKQKSACLTVLQQLRLLLFIPMDCDGPVIPVWNTLPSRQARYHFLAPDSTNLTGHCIGLWNHCETSYSGWWFGTCFIFPYIENNNPNWLIFFRGVETTNQYC